jgi:hypothetical protein
MTYKTFGRQPKLPTSSKGGGVKRMKTIAQPSNQYAIPPANSVLGAEVQRVRKARDKAFTGKG